MSAGRYVMLQDRGVIGIRGQDCRTFLQGLVSNDVTKVSPTRAIYAALLTPQGKYLHDFFIAEDDLGLLLDCEAERQADLLRRLTLYKLRAKIELKDLTSQYKVAAAFDDAALPAFGLGPETGLAAALAGGVVFVDPRLSAMGARAILPAGEAEAVLVAAGMSPAPAESYHQLRLSHAVPDGSHDLPVEKTFLLEANFEELNGVDFAKGCYVGQELTARTKYRGVVRKRLFRVEVDGPLPAPGTPIMLGEKEAGTMRSGLGRTGLALFRLEDVEAAAASGQPFRAGEARLTPVKPSWAQF